MEGTAKTEDLEDLLEKYAQNHASLSLLHFEQSAKSILEEMCKIRDDFQALLDNTARILAEKDKQGWIEVLEKAGNDTSQ